MLQNVCVFCGSSPGANPIYIEGAQALGKELASRDIGLVYGGGSVGLMGAVADAVLLAGGKVAGVIPESLADKEVAHKELTMLYIVKSMHERKSLMAEMSDAFIALPGGYGTFEEFCEVLTWTQLSLHKKPCAILNINGFYGPLLSQFSLATEERFVHPEHRDLVITDTSITALLDKLSVYKHSTLDKWIDRNQN